MNIVGKHGHLRNGSAIDKRRLSRHFLTMTPKTPRSAPNPTRAVEIVAFPSVQLLDVTGPLQVFASANDFMVEANKMPPYTIRVVAKGGQSVEASAGVTLAAHPLPPVEAGLDTLVIAGARESRQRQRILCSSNGCANVLGRPVAPHRSAPAPFCSPCQAYLMGDERLPIGHSARSLLDAFLRSASSLIRSSCATVRFGPQLV